MKILSWNVNGIRAIAKKGFLDILKKEDADIVCIQESKAHEEQLPEALKKPQNYKSFWNIGERPGYSGTGIYTKLEPVQVKTKFPEVPEFHEDGRVIEMEFEKFVLMNIYFPNGGTRSDGTEMLSYKLDFYDKYLDYIKKIHKSGKSTITCGDFNIAHTEIDIARPKENENSIGFLPVERAKIDKIIDSGFVDIFRKLNPEKKDDYTWWSYRTKARERNVGWRIDYFFASPELLPFVKNISHENQIQGSDHCPVKLEIDSVY